MFRRFRQDYFDLRAVWSYRAMCGLTTSLSLSCLSIDPEFIELNSGVSATGSDTSEASWMGSTMTDGISTESAGDSGVDVTTSESSESTSSEGTVDTFPDDFGDTDTHNTNDTENGEGSSTSVGETGSETSDSGETTGTATSDSTTDSIPDETSDSSESTSEDTGSEPCVPEVCMHANANAALHPVPWTYNYLYSYRFTSTKNQFIVRAEIVTGESFGTGMVGIWSDQGGGQRPNRSMGSRSWQMSQQNRWQGSNFPSPIPVEANRYYWLVYKLPFMSQAPVAQFGQNVAYRWSTNGGSTWNHQALPGMYRLYCCETEDLPDNAEVQTGDLPMVLR